MQRHLRIARPVSNLQRSARMYCSGLGLSVVGHFEDHEGFDGIMLGDPGACFHFEFTRCHDHPIAPSPTAEDLTVFYCPDTGEWQQACASMRDAGFLDVAPFNPFWKGNGCTFEDPDRYRVVLQHGAWRRHPESP